MTDALPRSWEAAGFLRDPDNDTLTVAIGCDFQGSETAHILHHLHRLERQMTEFASDQAHLDSDVASLGQVTASIETEIANLKQQPAAQSLDFTGLDAALSTLQGVAPSAPSPEPVTPAPVTEPAAEPVSTDTPAEPPTDTPAD